MLTTVEKGEEDAVSPCLFLHTYIFVIVSVQYLVLISVLFQQRANVIYLFDIGFYKIILYRHSEILLS